MIVQFGGQTPLNLAAALQAAGVPILGTSPDAIDLAEDRDRFGELLERLDIPAPAHGTRAQRGRGRGRWRNASAIRWSCGRPTCWAGAPWPSSTTRQRCAAIWPRRSAVSLDRPILIDQFLEDAFEVDVDAVCDGERVVIGGIMQHIEEAGIHSGDSACVLPPYKISPLSPQHHPRIHREAGAGAGRARADERAVRHQGRRRLRAGGEPARQPHGALCEQGDRRAPGEDWPPR